jgi:hypothetical protein
MQPETYHRIIQALRTYYAPHGVELFRRHDADYPFALLGTDLTQTLAPEPPRAQIGRADLPFYDERLIERLRANGAHLFNGRTFIYNGLTDDGRVRGALGWYFDYVATCIALEEELLAGGSTPLRDRLHAAVPPADMLTSGAGRSASMGVGVLTVFRTSAGYRALLVRRSGKTAHKPGAYHVLPAFTLQPSRADYPAHEWDLAAQIKREYLEELFGAEEMNGGDHPAGQQLDAMLADGRAELHMTGALVNLMTTHVALVALLLIHDESWYSTSAGNTWETGERLLLPFETDADALAVLPPNAYMNMAPTGAAALWLGVSKARALAGGV